MNRDNRSTSNRSDILQVMLVTIATACVWLLFASQFNIQEIVAALFAGLLAGAAGYALRVRTKHRQAGHMKWLRYIPSIMIKGLADCWTLTVMLFRMSLRHSPCGKFKSIPFEYGPDDPDDTGRRVLAVIGTTLQPNSYVAGFNREHGEVLIHQLDTTPEIPIAEELRRAE